LLRPTRDFVQRAGKAAHTTAQRAAKPHPADKGTLGRLIVMVIEDDGKTVRVHPVRSIVGIANTIEEGRRPGRRPPYKPIKKWMISHGIIAGVRGDSKRIRAIRDDIKARGTRGVHFMAQAAEVAERALKTGVPETEKEIRAMWERRG
jgi:hypothetical protein